MQAEYLLKSALHLARVLVMMSPKEGGPNSLWWPFRNGNTPVPAELLATSAVNVRVFVEVRPEGGKVPIPQLFSVTGRDMPINGRYRDILFRLMRNLKFDQDKEEDQTGLVPGKTLFTPEELVGNLIDYMDSDQDSFNAPPNYKGVESELHEAIFPNRAVTRITELLSIPGFTPARVQALIPYLTTQTAKIDINDAPAELLLQLDERMTQEYVAAIVEYREDPERGPFKDVDQTLRNTLQLDGGLVGDISSVLGTSSSIYQVIAKADYGTSSYFLRAYLRPAASAGPGVAGELPDIVSIELYG